MLEVDAGLVTGTAVGALAGASLLIFILIAVVIAAKILIHGMKPNHETLDVEMSWTVKSSEKEEEEAMRIVQQMEATTVTTKSVEKKLKKYLDGYDKNTSAGEALCELGVECEAENTVGSFKTIGVASGAAGAIQSGTDIKAAAEYISMLFREVREQEEFQEYEKLYFGMKDIGKFMDNRDEDTIGFGGLVSGFTSKRKVIQFLSRNKEDEGEKDSLPRGVLFKVQKAKGYNIGKLSDG